MKKKKSRKKAMQQFNALPKDVQTTLEDLFKQSGSQEDFLRLVMVGDCPFCGSSKTRDCDETPLGDITVGICLDCTRMWCLECGYLFPEGKTKCDHWAICDNCDFSGIEKGSCAISPDEC